MGRGSRHLTTLALTPLPPSYDLEGFELIMDFEQTSFHEEGDPGCAVQPPNGAMPRFIRVDEHYDEAAADKHNLFYYSEPTDLLADLLTYIRTTSTRYQYVYEYEPGLEYAGSVFIELRPKGVTYDYEPADVPRHAKRTSRLRAIKSDSIVAGTVNDTGRFAFVARDHQGETHLKITNEFWDIADAAARMAVTDQAFEAFYDVDVSEQPIPIRFGLIYMDAQHKEYELTEPR